MPEPPIDKRHMTKGLWRLKERLRHCHPWQPDPAKYTGAAVEAWWQERLKVNPGLDLAYRKQRNAQRKRSSEHETERETGPAQ